jgi:hypothetical protein
MAEVFVTFADPVHDSGGRAYHAQVCGAQMPDGRWEGWIEFIPIGAGEPLRTERETTQPNRVDAFYWATGLTPVYLDGALDRSLTPHSRPAATPALPQFEGPARHHAAAAPPVATAPRAVLDPFAIYAKGETLLRKELGALSQWHLVNIVSAFGLTDEPAERLNGLPVSTLIDLIVSSVQVRRL